MRRGEPPRRPSSLKQNGFIYAALILALAVMAAGSATFATHWSQVLRQDRERELMQRGAEFVQAIKAYYENAPGTSKAYPPSLQALLEDHRFVQMRRYLRKVARDPILLSTDWGLVTAADGGVMGVYSRSDQAPLRQAGFPAWVEVRGTPARYADLRFVYVPAQ